MNSRELVEILKSNFPKASFEMFLDLLRYVHYFPDIQFIDDKGNIVPPWNSKNSFLFLEDLPFHLCPIVSLKVWIFPKDTQVTVCAKVDGKIYESMPIFLNAEPSVARPILETLDIPKVYEAQPSYKES